MVILPSYDLHHHALFNEEENLEELHESLRTAASDLPDTVEFIFVNDGSTDGSTKILDTLAKKDDRVTAVHLRRNFGQTAGLMAGFDHAQGEIIVRHRRRFDLHHLPERQFMEIRGKPQRVGAGVSEDPGRIKDEMAF